MEILNIVLSIWCDKTWSFTI